MPKAIHDKLQREVESKHPDWSQKRKDAYVYGTLYNIEHPDAHKPRPKKKYK